MGSPRIACLEEGLRALTILLSYILLYYFIRLPTYGTDLAYYDNQEHLYHTLSFLHGKVPYRDDFNHHFVGYVAPYVWLSKIFGFSVEIAAYVRHLNQALVGLFTFLVVSRFAPKSLAYVCGLLAIGAREPWTLNFYALHNLSVLYLCMLYLCLRYLKTGQALLPQMAFFLCGAALTCDQRGLFFLAIPIAALYLKHEISSKKVLSSAAAFLTLPAAAILYLWANQALLPFWEQTIIFPSQFRSGSQSLLELITLWAMAHKYLYLNSPLLLLFGLFGLFALIFDKRCRYFGLSEEERSLLLLCALSVLTVPFFGARDFDYYTVTTLPFLAIMSGCCFLRFQHIYVGRVVLWLSLLLACALPFVGFIVDRGAFAKKLEAGDGTNEVVAYLKEHAQPQEDLYVWGYRYDIYLYLEKLAAYPFANQILIDPDQLIVGESARKLHVYPKYEELFRRLTQEHLPTWLVIFLRGDEPRQSSASDRLVNQLARERYSKVFDSEKRDFLDKKVSFRVYRKLVP